ncbi:MAG: ferrous iron transport protein B [Candidatus Thermoplasmatota archaeon]
MTQNITIALVGNANVGKSAIFNQLTGLSQVIGNWPGKTVEKVEGTLNHHGKKITIIDLPGIYSMSTYSQEEIIAREYIALQHPDVVINVVDATALERNLFFTLQLLEMDVPLIISLNIVDQAKKKGLTIDSKKLEQLLGVPVVETVAPKGIGVHELIDKALLLSSKHKKSNEPKVLYGTEIEKRIEKLIPLIQETAVVYYPRWTALKLLEGDTAIIEQFSKTHPDVVIAAKILSEEITQIHKEPCATVIAAERYAVAAKIVRDVVTIQEPTKPSLGERLDALSMHSVGGYFLMFSIMLGILLFLSIFGSWVSEHITTFFEMLNPQHTGFWAELLWNGGMVGFYASLAVAFGFILPFYLIIGVLEDSGYLPKIAYLMDRPCHSLGVHGKACMPMLVALGCNVPACVGCRIMETKRDRFIAIFLSTLVPCSARTAVILGLVGSYVGVQWALLLFAIDIVLIFGIGKILNRLIPGASVGIIMEMPPYRMPQATVVLKQAWSRFKPFLLTAVPLIILGGLCIEAMRLTGILDGISGALSPITVGWLGLPVFTGFLFIFGILRKEATLVLLTTVAGSLDIRSVMSPVQMIVFAFVVMVYVPCIATIAALVREIGWKNAFIITITEIGLAVFLGGILFRVLGIFL